MPAKGTSRARTARSGTTTHTASAAQMNAYKPLFQIGNYLGFWFNNNLDILKMSGGQLVSIKNEANCNDIWNVFSLYLQQQGLISGRGAVRRVRTTVAARSANATAAAGHTGTTRRTRSRRVAQVSGQPASST
jgi:hypothetical protein